MGCKMKCTYCGSEMKQLFTSFYCPHCEGKDQKREDGDIDIQWKFIGQVLRINYSVDSVIIKYIDTKSIQDEVFIMKNCISGINHMTTGNYTKVGLHLYKHTLVGNIFKIMGMGIK